MNTRHVKTIARGSFRSDTGAGTLQQKRQRLKEWCSMAIIDDDVVVSAFLFLVLPITRHTQHTAKRQHRGGQTAYAFVAHPSRAVRRPRGHGRSAWAVPFGLQFDFALRPRLQTVWYSRKLMTWKLNDTICERVLFVRRIA